MKNHKYMKKLICAVASDSGGHILPALSYCQKMVEREPGTKIMFVTSKKKLDAQILEDAKIDICLRYNLKRDNKIITLIQIIKIFFKTFVSFLKNKPSVIISTGGLISLPVIIAGKLQGIDVYLFELNAVPGSANKILKFFADKIFVVFPGAIKFLHKKKCELVEYPLRFDLQKISNPSELNFSCAKKIIFVLGGSQGSSAINKIITKTFLEDINFVSKIAVIHQTGDSDYEEIKNLYQNLKIESYVFKYQKDIDKFYKVADLIISRAGAGAIFEAKYFNKRCIMIPLEGTANNHQVENALEIEKNYPEFFTMLLQKEVENNPYLLRKLIYKNLLNIIE